MKRCPECGREYDNTMSFCLDDGAALLYGPASMDEPATAILHETASPAEAATRAQIHTTERTELPPSGGVEVPRSAGFDTRMLIVPLVLGVLLLVVVFGYRYFAAGDSQQIESIAVMPFVNESGNADVEYLSDGMTETLIKSLSQLPNLAVKSRSTVFYYKGKETSPKKIGDELGVQAVLLGHVGGRGEDLKLSLELVNTRTQDVIWTEQYERKRSELVSLQSEIAKDVSARLKSKLSGADEAKVARNSTTDPEAYQAYLKGRYHWNRRTAENLKKAIEQFEAAIDRDPNYALAYSGLADCYFVLNYYTGIPIRDTLPQAKALAERAIAIDDQLAEPHASLGGVNDQLWRWMEAEREFKRAIELDPHYATAYQWYARLLNDLGRFDDAGVMIKRAHEIDPLSSIISMNVSIMYQLRNDHNASVENSLKLIELDPYFSGGYRVLGLSYLKKGRHAEAIANLEKAVELSNRAGLDLAELGYSYGVLGKRAEAIAIANELKDKYAKKEATGKHVAAVYAGLGDQDNAFEWLDEDFQARGSLASIRWEIPFESLRDDPLYKDLLKRMGLPE